MIQCIFLENNCIRVYRKFLHELFIRGPITEAQSYLNK